MRMSPEARLGKSSPIVLSTTAAGTINHTARGDFSFPTKSASEVEPIAVSSTRSWTAVGDVSKTTHSWPSLRRRRTIFAPILPSPIIPSCICNLLILIFFRRIFFTPSLNTCRFVLGFEDFDELLITPRYLFHGSVTGDLVRTPIDKGIPETRATDGETDESRDRGGSCKP